MTSSHASPPMTEINIIINMSPCKISAFIYLRTVVAVLILSRDGCCDFVFCQVPNVVAYVFFAIVSDLAITTWQWNICIALTICHTSWFGGVGQCCPLHVVTWCFQWTQCWTPLVLVPLVLMPTMDQNTVARCFSAAVMIQALDVKFTYMAGCWQSAPAKHHCIDTCHTGFWVREVLGANDVSIASVWKSLHISIFHMLPPYFIWSPIGTKEHAFLVLACLHSADSSANCMTFATGGFALLRPVFIQDCFVLEECVCVCVCVFWHALYCNLLCT